MRCCMWEPKREMKNSRLLCVSGSAPGIPFNGFIVKHSLFSYNKQSPACVENFTTRGILPKNIIIPAKGKNESYLRQE